MTLSEKEKKNMVRTSSREGTENDVQVQTGHVCQECSLLKLLTVTGGNRMNIYRKTREL